MHIENRFESFIFAGRWMLAPFYLGLMLALGLLLVKFVKELIEFAPMVFFSSGGTVIVALLSLIDVVLVANLLIIIVFAGYENFVSRIYMDDTKDRPSWMGQVGFSELKMKLIGSSHRVAADLHEQHHDRRPGVAEAGHPPDPGGVRVVVCGHGLDCRDHQEDRGQVRGWAALRRIGHHDHRRQCLAQPQRRRERLARHGENRLASMPPRSKWLLLADQFKSLLILVLIAAAVLAGSIGDLKDAVVILVVVVLNALLGFWQEHRAEATLAALKKMLSPTARVRRDGSVQEIPATGLVPGDLVLLDAGDRVPADGRLLVAHNAEVDESTLTGESHPVGKDAQARVPAGAPLAERLNMAYMNTVVTRGRLELLVTATGMTTEMGRLTGMLAAAEPGATPLQVQLDGLGRRLAAIAGVVVALILTLGLMRGQPWVETLLTSIALAVAAIPEGLPAVVTVTLALGMQRMAKHRAIVKKLAAVETLGSTTVICSDKTGTLTLNQMTARAAFYRGRRLAVSGEGYGQAGSITAEGGGPPGDLDDLLVPAALCNESRIRDGALIGDPTEGALLALAAKGGVDAEALAEHSPRIAEVPFDSAHKFMASFHHHGHVVRMHVKGAPDVLIARSAAWLGPDGTADLDETARARLIAENEALAGQAMRVLAVAGKDIPAQAFDPGGELMDHCEGWVFQGLVGIMDPPRPEARDAIALCHRAGIQVKMITGDHRATAAAIARDLGLTGEVLDGREIDALSEENLSERIDRVSVFARVAPEHKVRIVRQLKARGHVVAMTGDGVNDAPALKTADIGVAMAF